jgi:hypothetical protein
LGGKITVCEVFSKCKYFFPFLPNPFVSAGGITIKSQTMTQIVKLPAYLLALILVVGSTSCRSKDTVVPPLSVVKRLLTAQNWQLNEVIDVQKGGVSTPLYKRGAPDNEDDFSAVRQLFKTDGSIIYTGQEGETGADGRYELLENDTRIRLSMPSWGLSVNADALKVTSGEFTYRLGTAEGYTIFTFGPAQ